MTHGAKKKLCLERIVSWDLITAAQGGCRSLHHPRSRGSEDLSDLPRARWGRVTATQCALSLASLGLSAGDEEEISQLQGLLWRRVAAGAWEQISWPVWGGGPTTKGEAPARRTIKLRPMAVRRVRGQRSDERGRETHGAWRKGRLVGSGGRGTGWPRKALCLEHQAPWIC